MSNEFNLPDSVMGFKTEDGHTFFISKADINYITTQIVVQGSITKQIVLLHEKDRSIEKADILYKILKENPDMESEMRNWYFQTISELLAGEDIEIENVFTKETVKLVDKK